MTRELVVLGAGGHGAVVVATALEADFAVVGVFDDDGGLVGSQLLGVPVLGPIREAEATDGVLAFAGIGDNAGRAAVVERTVAAWATLIHPSSVVAASAAVEAGSVVFAGAIIQPRTRVGRHSIVNSGAIVDHDCRVGDFVHIAPGATVCGDVEVGDGTLIGAGATLAPGVTIGQRSVVGAGAVVLQSIADNSTAVGVPARAIAGR